MLGPDKGWEVTRVAKALALRAAVIALCLGQQPIEQRVQSGRERESDDTGEREDERSASRGGPASAGHRV